MVGQLTTEIDTQKIKEPLSATFSGIPKFIACKTGLVAPFSSGLILAINPKGYGCRAVPSNGPIFAKRGVCQHTMGRRERTERLRIFPFSPYWLSYDLQKFCIDVAERTHSEHNTKEQIREILRTDRAREAERATREQGERRKPWRAWGVAKVLRSVSTKFHTRKLSKD